MRSVEDPAETAAMVWGEAVNCGGEISRLPGKLAEYSVVGEFRCIHRIC
jgi:hypothetical protein